MQYTVMLKHCQQVYWDPHRVTGNVILIINQHSNFC